MWNKLQIMESAFRCGEWESRQQCVSSGCLMMRNNGEAENFCNKADKNSGITRWTFFNLQHGGTIYFQNDTM